MILTCPQCGSRFLLSAYALSPEGRRVKCSNCAEVWFQAPDTEEINDIKDEGAKSPFQEIPESVKPIREGSALPVIPSDKSKKTPPGAVRGYAAAACIFLIIGICLVAGRDYIIQYWPPSGILYEALGYKTLLPAEGLEFDQITVTADSKNNPVGETIKIDGQIVNRAKTIIAIPTIQVDLRDENGNMLERWTIGPPKPTLAGGARAEFTSERQSFIKDGKDVNIKFILSTNKTSKTAAIAGGNNPALDQGGLTPPSAAGSNVQSPAPASAEPHPESVH